MWECTNCNEQVEDGFDICWNCQTPKDGSSTETYFSSFDDKKISQENKQAGRPVNPIKVLITSLITIALIAGALHIIFSMKSLGNYSQPLSTLLPDKIRNTKRISNDCKERPRRGLKEECEAVYETYEGKAFQVYLGNHDSKEDATKRASNLSPKCNVQKNGWVTLGIRCESSYNGIIWTNGSVLFIVSPSVNATELEEFESAYLDLITHR